MRAKAASKNASITSNRPQSVIPRVPDASQASREIEHKNERGTTSVYLTPVFVPSGCRRLARRRCTLAVYKTTRPTTASGSGPPLRGHPPACGACGLRSPHAPRADRRSRSGGPRRQRHLTGKEEERGCGGILGRAVSYYWQRGKTAGRWPAMRAPQQRNGEELLGRKSV